MSERLIPSPGQLVIVRSRPARVTDVRSYSGSNGVVVHTVDVRYCDGWFYPENESIIWEYELGKKIQSKLSLPCIEKISQSPDHPSIFNSYLQSLTWTNHSSWVTSEKPDIISPWFSAVQVEDYQLYPVMKSISMSRVALLLADDVGLGKTIQAGLILSELIRRRKIRKVLILCPASLQTQWQEEMHEKFHIDFGIINRSESYKIFKEMGMDTNPWRAKQRIITSIDYLRQPDILDQFLISAESSLNKDTPTMPWDLLIVDESHNMAPAGYGQESQRFLMLQQISKYFEHRLFLTATPHNGYTMSFTTLLSLLDPVRFSPKAVLEEEDHKAIQDVMIRRLKSELNENTDPARFPPREVLAISVTFSQKELRLFQALSAYRSKALIALSYRSRRERNLGRFLFSLLTKRLLSSSYAFARTWWQHVEGMNLDEEVDLRLAEQVQKRAQADIVDDEEKRDREEDAIRYGAAWMKLFGLQKSEELESLKDDIDDALADLGWTPETVKTPLEKLETLPEDGRWEALIRWIADHLKEGDGFRSDERLILFTEYLDTLHYLFRRFEMEKIEDPILQTLFGGASQEVRDLIKKEFNTEDSPLRILLATDAASEGLNFQYYCRYIFHQDIPWNPMRLEQRNGRVDRHNQARDVYIFHYTTEQQAEIEFLSRVIRKVNQVREDLGSVGQVFDEAIEKTFSHGGMTVSDRELDKRIEDVKTASHERQDTLSRDGGKLKDYQEVLKVFKRTESDLNISPDNLSQLFSNGMKIMGGEVSEEEKGIYRIEKSPPELKQLIEDSLLITKGRLQGSLPKVAFDTSIFEQEKNGRKIYRTKQDTVLLRLNHPIMKRLLGLFEKHMWGEDSDKIKRWTIVKSNETKNTQYEISCFLQCTNDLKEILHSEIVTYRYKVENSKLVSADGKINTDKELPLEELKKVTPIIAGEWLDIRDALQKQLDIHRDNHKEDLLKKAKESLAVSLNEEEDGFKNRKNYLKKQMGVKALTKLRKEIEKQEMAIRQTALFETEKDIDLREKRLRETRWQLEEHERRINGMLDYVEREEKRMLEFILPNRFSISHVDLQPVAVKVIAGEPHG